MREAIKVACSVLFISSVSSGIEAGEPSGAVPQLLQYEGELFGAGCGCQDPGGCRGDAEDDEDASQTPESDWVGAKFTSNMAAAI